MFESLGHLVYRRRRVVLGLAAAFVVIALVWGTGVFGRLSGGGFEDPNSESSRALAVAEDRLGRQATDVVVVYTDLAGSGVDDPAFQAAVQGTLDRLPVDQVASVTSYWSTGGAPQFVADDGQSTYAALQLVGDTEEDREAAYEEIADELVAPGQVETLRGGQVPTFVGVNEQVTEDIAAAESISLPILFVLLVVVFGSLAAASLPLAIGGLAILGAFTLLRIGTLFGDVSVFAINIVTMLGLGLAIDYALFVVSRFREELRTLGGASPDREHVNEALGRTMATAGRTVAFSGVTVAVSLAALLFFPQNFLRSMGFGGIAAVVVAMVAALTVLPALLAVMGPRVDSLRIRLPWRRKQPAYGDSGMGDPNGEHGLWARWARGVMRRPVLVVVGTIALLVTLGLPFLRVSFGGVDARALPEGTESRVAAEAVQNGFPSGAVPMDVVVIGASESAVTAYADDIAALPDVVGAQVTRTAGDTSQIAVAFQGEALDESNRQLVEDVRALPTPDGAEVLVGGESAELNDRLSSLGDRLPWAALFVVLVTFALLFLAFGSVVLPLKALVMNVFSLSAMLGVVVWVFQDGNLSGLLDFTTTGTIEATQPILMLAIAFGLSMDYEVFLLSRIREEWDATHDNTRAVARGLQRTGRIITSAAVLFVIVIGSFSTSGVTFIKMIGVGMIVAVLVDATIVRALLVPATMKLLGRWNWYAPAPLARFWDRHGIREGAELPPVREEQPQAVGV
ncbi:MAG: MMPL family transporter [Candidatus Nanopelagicales bacterium]